MKPFSRGGLTAAAGAKNKQTKPQMTLTRPTFSTLLLAAMLMLAAGMGACTKGSGPIVLGTGESGADEGTAVSFSAYTSQAATKSYDALPATKSYDAQAATKASALTPAVIYGTGIGVFAFHQQAKSNGYPTYFNKNIGQPNFMINQKLSGTPTGGGGYVFTYSPLKYWPNEENDLLSFFAYAPYDAQTAWEDLKLTTDLGGTEIKRRYDVDPVVSDQQDYLWADPVLNMERPTIDAAVSLSFRHLCSRIGVSCKADSSSASNYVTIDRVVLSASFNVTGDYKFTTATKTCSWTYLGRPDGDIDYVQYDKGSGAGQTVTTTETPVGGTNSYLFPLPGETDVIATINLTRHKSGASTPGTVKDTLNLALDQGKAYNILITVGGGGGEEEPFIEIGNVTVGGWDNASAGITVGN